MKLRETLGDLRGKTCAVLGVTYKPDVDDIREIPALEVVHLLREAGAMVRIFDPYVQSNGDFVALYVDSVESAVAGAEGILAVGSTP